MAFHCSFLIPISSMSNDVNLMLRNQLSLWSDPVQRGGEERERGVQEELQGGRSSSSTARIVVIHTWRSACFYEDEEEEYKRRRWEKVRRRWEEEDERGGGRAEWRKLYKFKFKSNEIKTVFYDKIYSPAAVWWLRAGGVSLPKKYFELIPQRRLEGWKE